MEQLQLLWEHFAAGFLSFLPRLISAAIILILAWIAARLLPKPICKMLDRTHLDKVATKYILRVVKIAIWALGLVMALDKLGIPVASFLTVLAAVGAAVALAVKDNLANFASGVVLLFTKPFKAGDFIELDGVSGTVREIELTHSYLDTPGNMRVAIPNTKMMTATIVNYSAYDTRRQDFLFTISYDNDLLAAKALLQDIVDHHPLVLKEPALPCVMVKEHAESAIVLLVRVWCETSKYWDLNFALTEQVKLAFDEHHITIPYNQLDVHVTQ